MYYEIIYKAPQVGFYKANISLNFFFLRLGFTLLRQRTTWLVSVLLMRGKNKEI